MKIGDVEIVAACMICGVLFAGRKFSTCAEEMADAGIETAPGLDLSKRHVFGYSKIVHGWYGDSIPQKLRNIEKATRRAR